MSRVDDAVQRILRAKFTRGLLESPLADSMYKAEVMGAHTKKERADCNPMQSVRVEERSNSSWSNGSKQERRKQQLLIRAGDQKNAAER
ncbi:glycosyl hydrolase family 3 N-terminal domain containing protein [Tanacetum coccineum]